MPRTFTLNTRLSIPAVGLGCWMGDPISGTDDPIQQVSYDMVRSGIDVGYTHFDTASGYGNEEAVGRAIRDSGKDRSSLFVTTKLLNSDHHRVAEAFEDSLKALGLEYIDLYLMHWPMAGDIHTGASLPIDASPTFSETWAEMEKLLETHKGKVRNIGVSNFSVKNLEILLKTAKVVPAVNQVEAHPYCPQTDLVPYCASKGIHLTAYSPVGQGASSPLFSDPLILSLAKKYNRSAGALLLSWGVQRGFSVVPKSANPVRQRDNLDVFKLEEGDVKALEELHHEPGKHRSLCDYGIAPDPSYGPDGPETLFGWKLKEDLGWDYGITVQADGGWGGRLKGKGKKE
ncbi:hypothetical protein JCM8097_006678 [Rhodosporidiobolus ruineniae]